MARYPILAVAVVLVFTDPCTASHHDRREIPKKVGILLVAFGSSIASAQTAFDRIDRKTKRLFPEVPVRWAFTSHMIRRKLAKQGKRRDSPETALAKMLDEKFTHVAVQSLHTIRGAEFDDLSRTVDAFGIIGGFQSIVLGQPLLSTQQSMERVVEAVQSSIPKGRKRGEGVVLMGHGTHHPSNAFYAALMFQLQLRDPNIIVGTVEGFPDIDVVTELLKRRSIEKVYLMPFMSVAGDHAINDMAGDAEDSWKTILTKQGIRCIPILRGTAEYDGYVDIWIGNLQEVVRRLSDVPRYNPAERKNGRNNRDES